MADESYIRGGGAVNADPRRVVLALLGLGVVVLLALTVLTFLSTADSRSKADRLKALGVPVAVTVTHCTGITSGIGMGVEYFSCEGSFRLGGAAYRETLLGNRSRLPAGSVVAARVVPGEPASVTAAAGSARADSYTVPIVLAVLTVLSGAATVLVARRYSSTAGAAEVR
jgi:hypothetical protein